MMKIAIHPKGSEWQQKTSINLLNYATLFPNWLAVSWLIKSTILAIVFATAVQIAMVD
jgi:hypothetical protein